MVLRRELLTVLAVVWAENWGGCMVVPTSRHVPNQPPWSTSTTSIKPVDPLVGLGVARSLVILLPSSQIDHIGHTQTGRTEQSHGELSSLGRSKIEPRKYFIWGHLFPGGGALPPYLCRGQSSFLPVTSPSSSNHNIVLTIVLCFLVDSWHVYPFFLCIDERGTGMTSPGLQHAGQVRLEASKIVQTDSVHSGSTVKPTSYNNSTRIISKGRIQKHLSTQLWLSSYV